MISSYLMVASVSVIGLLGLVHLILTFKGAKLFPRDPALLNAMKEGVPVITKQTTIWKMWLGFNASHSVGILLFALMYGYLAVCHSDLLFQSVYLQVLGLVVLATYVLLAKLYWFVKPLTGAIISLLLYVSSLVLAWGG